MIKDFLQFIKKTLLAVKLSRQGLFTLLSQTQTFKNNLLLAKISAKPQAEPDSFLAQCRNPHFLCLVQELLSAASLCGFASCFLPCVEDKIYQDKVKISLPENDFDWPFYSRLLQELCRKDFAKAKGLYKAWQNAADLSADMRLYGALLEEVNQSAAPLYTIDWVASSKQTLVLNFIQPAKLTDKLSVPAQKNLALRFAELFFVEKMLVEAWNGVLCTQDNQIGFINILSAQKLELTDINFAVDFWQKNKKPQTLVQSKIVYAFGLLRFYCPDINLAEVLDSFLRPHFLPKSKGEQNLLKNLHKHGMVYMPPVDIKFTSPKSLTYLLDSHRHKKDSRFKKSSALYVLLLLLAYLLLRYF